MRVGVADWPCSIDSIVEYIDKLHSSERNEPPSALSLKQTTQNDYVTRAGRRQVPKVSLCRLFNALYNFHFSNKKLSGKPPH